MNWYYVEAGQQAGPVDDLQLEALVGSGKIQPDTLVWNEGMTAWTPYKEAVPAKSEPAGAPPVMTAAPAGVVCSECGRAFSADQVIRYGERFICAACKPIFFQRLQEGAALGGAGIAGKATEADLLARDYQVDVGGSLSRGWEVFKARAGILIGASLLVYLAMIAINVMPYVNVVLGLLLTGPLFGGLWVFYVRNVRNQEVGVGEAFSGFGPRFWQLVLTQLVPGLISFGFIMFFSFVAALIIPGMAGSRRLGASSAPPFAGLLVPMMILMGLFAVVMIYLTTCWMFALPLVGDKGLKFWPALELSRRVVSKHWWMTFWLMFVCWIVAMLGIFGCLIGMLVTAPIAFAAVVAHYEKVFGDLAPSQR